MGEKTLTICPHIYGESSVVGRHVGGGGLLFLFDWPVGCVPSVEYSSTIHGNLTKYLCIIVVLLLLVKHGGSCACTFVGLEVVVLGIAPSKEGG